MRQNVYKEISQVASLSECKKELCLDLKQLVQSFAAGYPNLSLPQISKKINVAYPTLNRIMNGSGNPSLSVVTNILVNTGNGKRLEDFMTRMEPEMARAFKNYFAHNHDTPVLDPKTSTLFANKDYLFILLLAFSKSGTSREEIRDEYGKSGINRLEELIEQNIVKETSGIIRGDVSRVTFNQKVMKEAVLHCIEESYDPTQFGKGTNWLSLQTESVNKEKAVPEIRRILQNAYTEIKNILYSDDYQGEDKIFVSMTADTITSKDNDRQEVLQ